MFGHRRSSESPLAYKNSFQSIYLVAESCSGCSSENHKIIYMVVVLVTVLRLHVVNLQQELTTL